MVQGIELQVKLRAQVKRTTTGEALMFGFALGPIQVFIIAGLPGPEDPCPLVYIKVSLKPTGDWELFKEHTPRQPRVRTAE
jgi:hypothetical protein